MLWIGTPMGLSRFDGTQFRNYTIQDGLRENYAAAIDEDDSGRIWVATKAGISCYTGGSPRAFRRCVTDLNGLSTICCGKGGYLYYVNEHDQCVYCFHNNRVTRLRGLATDITGLAHDETGIVYVLSATGTLYVIAHGAVTACYTLPAAAPYNYTLTAGLGGRILLYDKAKIRFLKADEKGIHGTGPPPPRYRYIGETGQYSGRYYSHYLGHLLVRSRGPGWDTLLRPADLQGIFIYNVAEAADSTLWIGTSNGIYHLGHQPDDRMTMRGLRPYFAADRPGSSNRLHTDAALQRQPAARQWCRQLQHTLSNTYLGRDSTLWFCTTDGLYRLPAGSRQAIRYTAPLQPGIDSNYKRYSTAVLEDAAGRTWFGAYWGVDCYSHGRYRHYSAAEGIVDNEANSALAEDTMGVIYAGNGQLFGLAPGADRFICLSRLLRLPYDAVQKLERGPDGHIWMCQANSLLRKLAWTRARGFYVADSLQLQSGGRELQPSSISFDHQGNLWVVGTQLSVYLRPAGKQRRISDWPHLLLNDVPIPGTDAGIYMGTANDSNSIYLCAAPSYDEQIFRYDRNRLLLRADTSAPRLFITELRLFDKRPDWASAGWPVNTMGIPVNPVLRHGQNFITFRFAATRRGTTSGIACRYRLTGLAMDWIYTSSTPPVANFTRLGAGSYCLELEAADALGRWRGHLAYPFTILPAWYASWWARLLWALLAAGAVLTAFRLRVRAVRRQAYLRQRMTEEQLKALRAQINPHMLQNLFEFLTWQIRRASPGRVVQDIHHISAYLRNVLYRSDETVLTLEQELAFTDEYLRTQQMVLPAPFTYEITEDDSVDAVYDMLVPCMLLQPTVENALKYGLNPDGPNHIAITVRADDRYLYCTVSDSGSRQPLPPKPAGYRSKGQQLTLQRMELLYGKTQLRPALHQVLNAAGGLTVTLQIPLL